MAAVSDGRDEDGVAFLGNAVVAAELDQ